LAKHTIPILGVPSADMNDFKRWSDDMSARFGPLPLDRQIEGAKSEVDFQHYFATKLEERRRRPDNRPLDQHARDCRG
jgi:cytochrome P450